MGIINRLARDFIAHAPNTKWVSDITYLRTGEGWVYLAVILDLCTRRVGGGTDTGGGVRGDR